MFSKELNDNNNVPLARIVSSVPASAHACSGSKTSGLFQYEKLLNFLIN